MAKAFSVSLSFDDGTNINLASVTENVLEGLITCFKARSGWSQSFPDTGGHVWIRWEGVRYMNVKELPA